MKHKIKKNIQGFSELKIKRPLYKENVYNEMLENENV